MKTGDASELGPLQFSEVILRTSKFDAMRAWYRQFFDELEPTTDIDSEKKLSIAPTVDRICFLRIHSQYPYTQVLGIFEIADLAASAKPVPGLDHMQFRERALPSLFSRYRMLKKAGHVPYATYNHGPSTSFYYHDPDGNTVELSAVNFDTEKEYLEFFKTDEFKRNIEGHLIDVEEYMAAYFKTA